MKINIEGCGSCDIEDIIWLGAITMNYQRSPECEIRLRGISTTVTLKGKSSHQGDIDSFYAKITKLYNEWKGVEDIILISDEKE